MYTGIYIYIYIYTYIHHTPITMVISICKLELQPQVLSAVDIIIFHEWVCGRYIELH